MWKKRIQEEREILKRDGGLKNGKGRKQFQRYNLNKREKIRQKIEREERGKKKKKR